MIISIIAAVAKNNVIGNKNKIPWYIPEDFKYFKEKTSGHTVVMGQNTFESIGKALPNRTNIVLSFNPNYKADNAIVTESIDKAINIAQKNNENELFIIGGASVYKQTIDMADKLYITQINQEFEGDTFFPEIDLNKWKLESTIHNKNENYEFSFCVYTKKS